jgi:HSP20 family protein
MEEAKPMSFEITEAQDGQLVLSAELRDIEPEEVKVTVENGILTVSGEHRTESEEEKDGVTRRETHRVAFSRSVRVPPEVGAEDVETSFEDGRVKVTVPGPRGE